MVSATLIFFAQIIYYSDSVTLFFGSGPKRPHEKEETAMDANDDSYSIRNFFTTLGGISMGVLGWLEEGFPFRC